MPRSPACPAQRHRRLVALTPLTSALPPRFTVNHAFQAAQGIATRRFVSFLQSMERAAVRQAGPNVAFSSTAFSAWHRTQEIFLMAAFPERTPASSSRNDIRSADVKIHSRKIRRLSRECTRKNANQNCEIYLIQEAKSRKMTRLIVQSQGTSIFRIHSRNIRVDSRLTLLFSILPR